MNKTILLMIFILSLPLSLAVTGGETTTIFDGKCAELLVNISIDPSQDEGEFGLEPNCEVLSFENNVKSFKCICENNRTTLELTPVINSVGNYTYKIEQYIWKDNETTESVRYNTTNPTDKNITTIITLPNNMTVERVIQPGEELVYVETKEEYVIIPEANVTFDSINSDNKNINIIAESSGYKCFDIYTENGEPYSVSIDGSTISFGYNSTTSVINFCTIFSTKIIGITWAVPVITETPSGGGYSTGGGGGGIGVASVSLKEGESKIIKRVRYVYIRMKILDDLHIFRITKLKTDSVIIEFWSEPITVEVFMNKPVTVGNLQIELLEIIKPYVKLKLTHVSEEIEEITEITEEIKKEIEEIATEVPSIKEEEEIEEEPKKTKNILLTIFLIIVGMIVILLIYKRIKKRKKKEDEKEK